MGCGVSSDPGGNEEDHKIALAVNHKINEMLKADLIKEKFSLKLLMLGPGGSGKSTVVKQMKILQNQTCTPNELQHYRNCILMEMVKAVVIICRAYKESGKDFADDRKRDYYTMLNQCYHACLLSNSNIDLTSGVTFAIKSLVDDKQLGKFTDEFIPRSEDATFYFLQHIERLCAANYQPTNDDMLNLRIPTNGAYEVSFHSNNVTFRVVDVAGQKAQRRKWIKCFDGVDGLMFLAALSDFNIPMEEDKEKNRMIDAMEIWQVVCQSHFFTKSCIMLFLNKKDALKEKIKTVQLKDYFETFTGENSYSAVVAYFLNRFQKIAGLNRSIYSHVTCATDTEQMKDVIRNCLETIALQNMQKGGVA